MKRLGELSVADYMTPQAVVVDDTERLTRAIGILGEQRLSVLPVVDQDGIVVGILSNTDLLQVTHELQADIGALNYVNESTREFLLKMIIDQGDFTRVRDVMTAPVETISPETNLIVAARKLVDRNFHHLPVVDGRNAPIGVISTSDFVRAVADYGSLLAG